MKSDNCGIFKESTVFHDVRFSVALACASMQAGKKYSEHFVNINLVNYCLIKRRA